MHGREEKLCRYKVRIDVEYYGDRVVDVHQTILDHVIRLFIRNSQPVCKGL